jgi:hypothetical protein
MSHKILMVKLLSNKPECQRRLDCTQTEKKTLVKGNKRNRNPDKSYHLNIMHAEPSVPSHNVQSNSTQTQFAGAILDRLPVSIIHVRCHHIFDRLAGQ